MWSVHDDLDSVRSALAHPGPSRNHPELVEAPHLGNEDGAMPKERTRGTPTARRYREEEKAPAVRLVQTGLLRTA